MSYQCNSHGHFNTWQNVVAVVKVLSLKKTRSGLTSCWNICSGGQ